MPTGVRSTSDESGLSSINCPSRTAINRANETIRHLRWFEVVQTRGHVENGKISHYQVTLKVGFTMEQPD
jgi:flavin-binding protein dodecin